MSNPIYTCPTCDKSFSSVASLSGHQRVHSIKYEDNKQLHTDRILKLNNIKKIQYQKQYYLNPKLCIHCNTIIPYDKKENKYCNSSCAASYTNKLRDYSTAKETWNNKRKNDDVPKSKHKAKTLRGQRQKGAPFTRIYHISCQHCSYCFLSRIKGVKYCDGCKHLYSNNGKAKYWFTFNVFEYPDLFDLSLLRAIGFYHHRTNKSGLTRDHKISINNAIKNNYDPYYIKHPLNCELMSFADNNKKKTKSSITYTELMKIVDDFDSKRKEKGLAPTPN